jgi:hypothetical protein
MTIRTVTTLLLAAGVLFVQSSSAQMAFGGQARHAATSVLVNGNGESDSGGDSEVAPDNGPFDVDFTTRAAITVATAEATTAQHSVMTSQAIDAVGMAAGSGTVEGDAIVYAFAESNIAIQFTLLQPTYYTLQGSLESTPNGRATVQVSRPFDTVAWYSAEDGWIPVYQTGFLEADTYTINVTCNGSANAGPSTPLEMDEAAYDIHFLLQQSTDAPAPAFAESGLRAFPNPFQASTRLEVPAGVDEVRVLDATGRLVRTLRASSSLRFDGRDEAGRPLSAGVYWMKPVGTADVGAVKVVRLP